MTKTTTFNRFENANLTSPSEVSNPPLDLETKQLISALAQQLSRKTEAAYQEGEISSPQTPVDNRGTPYQALKTSIMRAKTNNRLAKAKCMAAIARRNKGQERTFTMIEGQRFYRPNHFNQLPSLRSCLKFITHANDDHSSPASQASASIK